MVSLLADFNRRRGGDPAHTEQQAQLMLFTDIMLMIRPSEGAEDVPLAARMCFWPTIAGQTFPVARQRVVRTPRDRQMPMRTISFNTVTIATRGGVRIR